MDKKPKRQLTLTALVVLGIIFSICVLIYINLPQQETKDDDSNGADPLDTEDKAVSLLTIEYKEEKINYTLEELESLSPMTASGSYIKDKALPDSVIIKGPYEYTGVPISIILDDLPELPQKYSLITHASDNWTVTYNESQIQGNVAIYDESGIITGYGGVTMLLAYKEDGEYIEDPEIGPLRIAFVDNGSITSSALWTKMVVTLEIIAE
jgi:hypothetical protein